MDLKVKQLDLQNFKGIDNLTIPMKGNVTVSGDNATGKTTIYDAWLWLLFNKDSSNKADFEVKPLNADGTIKHNLDVSVSVTTEIDSKEYIFKKILQEKWTKKREQAQQEFSGNTIRYFINKVPKSQGEFQDAIDNIIDEKIFKVLSSVKHFNEFQSWQERRETLFKIADIKNNDLSLAIGEFASLAGPLNKYSLSDYRKVLSSTKTRINNEIKSIPIRIDELTKGLQNRNNMTMPEYPTQDLPALKDKRQKLINEPVPINPKQTKIAQLSLIVAQKQVEKDKKINELSKGEQLSPVIIKSLDVEIVQVQKNIEKTRKEWYEENKKRVIDETDTGSPLITCPTCGQTLPEEQMEEAIEQFNLQKAKRLADITLQGEKLVSILKNYKKTKVEYEKALEKSTQIQEQIEAIRNEEIPEIDEIERLMEQADNMEVNPQVAERKQQVDALTLQIEVIEQHVAEVKAQGTAKARITELQEEEKRLSVLFAENEDKTVLTDKFITHKVGLIEETINDKFEIARFKLFNALINGGIEDACETMVDGIPYRNLNGAMKINVGLDIIKTLQQFYNTKIPIFIDNAESVNELINMDDTQMIRLVVSKDKKLKVEEV